MYHPPKSSLSESIANKKKQSGSKCILFLENQEARGATARNETGTSKQRPNLKRD
jgi:hypothetical protein